MTAPSLGWGTWNADLPAQLRHPASGLIITPVLYAASQNKSTRLSPGPGVIFGPRPIDGDSLALDLSHAGTALDWRCRFGADDSIEITWHTKGFGEWGLRFWVLICVHGGEDLSLIYDPASGRLAGSQGDFQLQAVAAKKPLMTTFHDDLEALERELFDHGYFYLASRGTAGHFAALRFNLEEAPAMTLRLSVSKSGSPALAKPRLPSPQPENKPPAGGAGAQGALAAVHDVMAWNHTFDFINHRPYTVLSRFWTSHKFGGFGVWLDDILYNALLWGRFDLERARHNLDAVFAWQTEAGNFPCLVTGNDAWLDRTQPPIASYVIWTLFLQSGDESLLSRYFHGLLRNYDWWWARRRLGETGLVAFGTSLDAGDGLYKGTKLAAKDESTMDNSPLHDPVPFDEESGLLLAADVAVNSLLALDGEILGLMADRLGHGDIAERLREQMDAHKARIADWLWDDSRGVFANRMLDGRFVAPLAPTSFYPLVAGIGSVRQIDSLITGYLDNSDKFGGPVGLPSITRDDPAYGDNVYWRGRVWGPLNFWVYHGLRRAGRDKDAAALADKSWRLFQQGWKDRQCGENYHAESGAITDQPDTDSFYSWGALLAELAVADVSDVSPWAGWCLQAPAQPGIIGPLATPLGPCHLHQEESSWRLTGENGQTLLASNLATRLTDIDLSSARPSVTLTTGAAQDAWISFPSHPLTAIQVGDTPIPLKDGKAVLPPSGNRLLKVVGLP